MGLTDTSKFLSLVLRHKPDTIGISLDEHGWANVSELIESISKTRPFDMEMLEKIVQTDNKQRYSFNEDKTFIRANQIFSNFMFPAFAISTVLPFSPSIIKPTGYPTATELKQFKRLERRICIAD